MTHRINLRSNRRAAFLGGLLLGLLALPMLATWSAEPGLAAWGAAFALTALHLITRVRRLEIEPGLRSVRYRSGYVFPLFTRTFAWDSIREVHLRVRIKKRGDKRKRTYWLVFRDNADADVCRLRGAYFSRSVGERIAGILNIPLVDQVTGMGQKRAARNLETPLVEIWKRRGRRHATPALPAGTSMNVNESPSEFVLRLAPRGPLGNIIVAACSVFYVPILGALAGMEGLDFAFHQAYLLLVFWCSIVIFLALSQTGRSTIRITTTDLTFRQGRFPIRQSIPISEIEQWVTAFDGIHLIGDSGQVFIDYAGSEQDHDFIRDAVRYHLQRLGDGTNQM